MRKNPISLFVMTVVCAGFVLILLNASHAAEIITPDMQHALNASRPEDELSVLVSFVDTVSVAAITAPRTATTKPAKRTAIMEELQQNAHGSQAEVQAFLKANNVKRAVPLWINNTMAVTATASVIQDLARQPGVRNIRADTLLELPEPEPATTAAAEWNLEMMQVPALWNLGFRGTGIIVAAMDTGVDNLHNDLKDSWRGGDNSWYDPNEQHATPFDADGHGTQVMGLLAGGSAGGTAIGSASGAQWIAVKIYNDAGVAALSAIHSGFQWLLDPDGDPQTDDAPDVVNLSWGFQEVQCDFLEFADDIQILKASEILVVCAAGNDGPNPATSVSPANYGASFAVGAIDDQTTIASKSSRGPAECDGSIFPEIVAPGVDVKTCNRTSGGVNPEAYIPVSGTSFAAPLAAGVMALLREAFPEATGSEVETAILDSAVDLGEDGPDNDYGYGMIDALEAYNNLLALYPQCTDADLDGFFAGAGCPEPVDCDDDDPTIYPGAVEIRNDGIDQDCDGVDLFIPLTAPIYLLLDLL